MSLIKNIEIDTLKLRALQVRDTLNNPISSGFQLFAQGDGTTYWSAGVNTQQFIDLSTNIEATNSTLDNLQSTATSTIENIASTLTGEVFSSIYSISSFINNLQTYSVNTAYTDAVVGQYSVNMQSTLTTTYQTISAAQILYSSSIQNTADAIQTVNIVLSSISASIVSTNITIANNSTITTSTIFGGLSTYTTSTFNGVFVIESTNFATLNDIILANVAFTQNSLAIVSTNQGQAISTFNSVPSQLTSTVVALSTLTFNSNSTTYASSIVYTNNSVSTLWISTLRLTSTIYSSTQSELVSTVSSLNNLRNQAVSSILSTVYQASTVNGSTLAYFNENISVLLSTGLTQNIYQTFIDLQAYSEAIIASTISTSNTSINSTNTALEQQSVSSFNGLMDSTFAYINNDLYYSSISTLTPFLVSTVNAEISSSNSTFTYIITSTTQYFTLLTSATFVAFSEDTNALYQTTVNDVSTLLGDGFSTQNGILSSSKISYDDSINQLKNDYIYPLSSFTYSQYKTAPSIIVNHLNNISTLTNTEAITGQTSISAGIVSLDTANFNNFYVLISSIHNNYYYGLALSTTSASKINQDFTVQIDIQTTQPNNYFILDTSNLSHWLNTPRIYNPRSNTIVTNDLDTLKPTNIVQQVFLSSFIGAYIIDMKYTQMGMFIKSIQSYPFIYTNVTFTGSLIIPQNVQVSNQTLALNSTFVYRGTPITVTWQTNDVNVPLGVKFTGTDLYGRQITNWAGPFSSAPGSAIVKIPTPPAPFARYNKMYLGVYPNSINFNTAEANSNTTIFSTRNLASPIHVVNPTINSYTRVLNPGTVNSYLQVAEVQINNDLGLNMTQVSTNSVFTIDTDITNVNSYPYNGSYAGFGSQNAFDNNFSTYFFGGFTASLINPNATVAAQFSTTTSFQFLNQSSVLVSSIAVTQGPTFSLQNMQLIFSNRNEPGINDGLFFSTITLISSNRQTFSFN
jgi:hypothetical protein